MSETNGRGQHAALDVIESSTRGEIGSFFDPTDPAFAPPKQPETKKKELWKGKLIGWCFVLFLIVGGGIALYLLLRVNHVNVKVQADSRRESQIARADPSPRNSENGLSAEAISIARQAMGNDIASANNANPIPSPTSSPTVSPSPITNTQRSLSFTDNSPAYSHPNDAGSANGNGNQNSPSTTQPAPREVTAQLPQTRANSTQTLFVEDSQPKILPTAQLPTLAQIRSRSDKKSPPSEPSKTALAVLPPFGTMLPVRTQGVIFSLRNDSYARLELTRDCQGEGWSLQKGTLLIGHVSGSEYDRAYVKTVGYIDPKTNRLVKMTGEVLGSDGGSGIPGKRIVVDRNRLKNTLSKVASSGLQVAGTMAGALTGRGTVVVNGAGYRILNPVTDEAGRIINNGADKRAFVKVEAGRSGYVMVADLPKELHAVDAPGEDEFARAATSLGDREVMELILFGTPEELRTALPLMSDDQRKLVLKSLGGEGQKQ